MDIEKLFQIDLEDLLMEKENALFNLREEELVLIKNQWLLKDLENKLLLETDFKELKLTNDKLRSAFVDDKTKELKNKIDLIKNRIKVLKDSVELINNVIEFRKE